MATVSPSDAYSSLTAEVRKARVLGEVGGILSYDEQVFMPPGGAAGRARQKAVLAGLGHELKTGPAMVSAIEGARGHWKAGAYEGQREANVRLAIESFDKESLKSAELAEREAQIESEAFEAWKKARAASDFSAFADKLSEVFEIKKEIARLTHPDAPYDGALDNFERGTQAERLDAIFAETREGLKPLLDDVLARPQPAVHPSLEPGPAWADVDAQSKLARSLAEDLGYDFECGRLDVSAHPFTGGANPSDTRITTRFSPENWLEGITGVIHEVGHALYEQGRDVGPDGDALPASDALSMGIHESQSLLWERMVLQSRPFADFLCQKVKAYFPHASDATPDDFYRVLNRVTAGKIRVEADELTYPFHVFLRYDLERALFAGDLDVRDVPARWTEAMRESLGVEVDGAAADGALQDIHWSFGAVGYFPSYTLGAIAAAQIFEAARANLPTLDDDIRRGHFAPLRDWLRTNIHKRGSVPVSPDALLHQVTGTELSPQPFLRYLRAKYSGLYDLESS